MFIFDILSRYHLFSTTLAAVNGVYKWINSFTMPILMYRVSVKGGIVLANMKPVHRVGELGVLHTAIYC